MESKKYKLRYLQTFEKDLLEDKLPKEFEALGYKDLLYVELDVTSVESIQNLMKVTYEKYGRIDAVCANAGITDMCKFVDMTPERFDHMISINLRGVYATDWAAIPYFLKQGYGKIVNTASDCALEGWEYLSSYYQYYVKKFHECGKKSCRIHFFRGSRYGGYITVSPVIHYSNLSKSYLSPELLLETKGFLMTSEFTANVFGHQKKVFAFPWMNQQKASVQRTEFSAIG